jgi:hypothetical protein
MGVACLDVFGSSLIVHELVLVLVLDFLGGGTEPVGSIDSGFLILQTALSCDGQRSRTRTSSRTRTIKRGGPEVPPFLRTRI